MAGVWIILISILIYVICILIFLYANDGFNDGSADGCKIYYVERSDYDTVCDLLHTLDFEVSVDDDDTIALLLLVRECVYAYAVIKQSEFGNNYIVYMQSSDNGFSINACARLMCNIVKRFDRNLLALKISDTRIVNELVRMGYDSLIQW